MSIKTSASLKRSTQAQAGPSVQAPNTLSSIQRSSAHSELQTISADYYNITDSGGAPLAGLLVLMDRKQRPVRAELQLYETTTGAGREQAQRQAQLLLGDRYYGDHPLPLTVVRSLLEHERLAVPLQAVASKPRSTAWIQPLVLALVALLVFGSMGWFLNDLLSGTDAAEAVVASEEEGAQGAEATSAAPAAGTGDSAVDDAEATVEGRIYDTNDLPVSKNAIPMEVGQRLRIRPTLQVALRTEPGATAGQVVGTMKDSMEATIVNGPVWMPGNSDTIVWWFVELDDGTRAWVAANTSDLTLLEPVQ